jgi:multiple antibiotic resistance protein
MFLNIYLHALTSYFVIIDPIGTALIFHGLTAGSERSYTRRMAMRSVLISTLIVLLFGLGGEAFLTSLGISIAAFRVAGGMLLFYTAFNMITRQGRAPRRGQPQIDISVYPLSIPLIAGPGCLTLTILLFSQKGAGVPLFFAVVTIFLLTLATFLVAGRIHRLIGQTGDDILRRLLGVVLAALAVQFIADGVRQLAG